MRILEEKHDVNAALFMVTLKGHQDHCNPSHSASQCPLTSGGRMEVAGATVAVGGGDPHWEATKAPLGQKSQHWEKGVTGLGGLGLPEVLRLASFPG